jgi:chromosome segregation protein
MLTVEKIVIQGFKSFKKKVSIPLPSGFSCITGPNGSGKTNVLDAFCFVLGKTSSRTMRAKKSQDLIFHGSKKKGGSDFANVMLYFDNRKGALPLEKGSVTMGRKINKKGVSTYRLNGKVVTRQQILDIFSNVGLHPDGHNIIQQGDVNQIVEMDPVERRGILDSMSGISDYDEKKAKAMKELAKIDEKVREAEIVLNEKQQVMEKLKAERDAALKFRKLESDLEKIRASLIWIARNDSRKDLEGVNKSLGDKERLSDELEKEIKKHDGRIAEIEKKMGLITKDAMKVKEHLERAKSIEKLRAEIEIKTERMESNKREMERIRDMAEQLSSVSSSFAPGYDRLLKLPGVHGAVSDLLKVPEQYKVAVEVAAGSRLKDIVVDSTAVAVRCVKFLKKERIGRARFLPLDKIRPFGSRFLPKEAVDWLSNLVKYNGKYSNVMEFVFGGTACVKDIDVAKSISRTQKLRMVTLDGDLFEASGAVTGGFYKARRTRMPEKFCDTRSLEADNEKLAKELRLLEKELQLYVNKEKQSQQIGAVKDQAKLDLELKKIRESRKEAFEKRLTVQQEMSKFNIKRAKIEASFDNLKAQWGDKDIDIDVKELKPFIDLGATVLSNKRKRAIQAMQELGPVNLKALNDFEQLNEEFEDFKEKVNKIVEERNSIMDTINTIESKRRDVFMRTFDSVSAHFKEVYKELTGGMADLELEQKDNIDSGLMIKATPPGKKLLNMDSMSGGEKTLTAFAFIFATQKHRPSPFYILDEADATLDKANTKRVVELLRKQSRHAQFVVISHNDSLVREADQIYGVSMEDGESKVFGVKLPESN